MPHVVALERPREPLSVVDREARAPSAGEVCLRVEACALGLWDWNLLTLDAPPRLPLVAGVEAVGVVESVGEGVALTPGTRVLVTPLESSCGRCTWCQRGEARWCAQARLLGGQVDGALGTHVTLSAQHLVRAPGGVATVELACLGGSGWTAVAAVRATRLEPGQRLGVVGVGGVGHLAVQVALARGLRVAVADVDEARQRWAIGLGAEPLEGEAVARGALAASLSGLARAPSALEAEVPAQTARSARSSEVAQLDSVVRGELAGKARSHSSDGPALAATARAPVASDGAALAGTVRAAVASDGATRAAIASDGAALAGTARAAVASDGAALADSDSEEPGLDAALVCTPSLQALQRAARLVKPGGVLVAVGWSPTGRVDLGSLEVVGRGLQLVGSLLGSAVDLSDAVALAEAGKLRPVVHVAPLDAAPDRLWQLRDGGFVGRLVFTS